MELNIKEINYNEAKEISKWIYNEPYTMYSIDIGLGIKPNLCSKGLGFNFLCEGINFAKNKLLAKSIRLTVASFNKRAIKVYKRAGFEKVHSFERITETERTDFQVMIKKNYMRERCNIIYNFNYYQK